MKAPRSLTIPLVSTLLVMMVSCKDQAERMGKGFRLPEGNIERGQAAFLQMKCHQCHPVAGVTLPNPDSPSPISLELGGVVRKAKTYGELVTAIIRPQHILSPEQVEKLGVKEGQAVPSMPSFNDMMTVTQMTDIVTFLHSHYLKPPPPGVNYPYYAP